MQLAQSNYANIGYDYGDIEVIKLPHYPFELPYQQTEESAGVDLYSTEDVGLMPGCDVKIPTGLKIHIGSNTHHKNHTSPFGLFGMIVPRSSLGFKHYLRLANTAGIIDADYQGEIFIKLRNEGHDFLEIKAGDALCQMIFMPYLKQVKFVEVGGFAATDRGEGGIGSTGR